MHDRPCLAIADYFHLRTAESADRCVEIDTDLREDGTSPRLGYAQSCQSWSGRLNYDAATQLLYIDGGTTWALNAAAVADESPVTLLNAADALLSDGAKFILEEAVDGYFRVTSAIDDTLAIGSAGDVFHQTGTSLRLRPKTMQATRFWISCVENQVSSCQPLGQTLTF